MLRDLCDCLAMWFIDVKAFTFMGTLFYHRAPHRVFALVTDTEDNAGVFRLHLLWLQGPGEAGRASVPAPCLLAQPGSLHVGPKPGRGRLLQGGRPGSTRSPLLPLALPGATSPMVWLVHPEREGHSPGDSPISSAPAQHAPPLSQPAEPPSCSLAGRLSPSPPGPFSPPPHESPSGSPGLHATSPRT